MTPVSPTQLTQVANPYDGKEGTQQMILYHQTQSRWYETAAKTATVATGSLLVCAAVGTALCAFSGIVSALMLLSREVLTFTGLPLGAAVIASISSAYFNNKAKDEIALVETFTKLAQGQPLPIRLEEKQEKQN